MGAIRIKSERRDPGLRLQVQDSFRCTFQKFVKSRIRGICGGGQLGASLGSILDATLKSPEYNSGGWKSPRTRRPEKPLKVMGLLGLVEGTYVEHLLCAEETLENGRHFVANHGHKPVTGQW